MESSNRKIKIRWNKDYLTIDNSSLVKISDLKSEIQKQSQVPSDEQMLIFKGQVLQDEEQISTLPLNPMITMLGSVPKSVAPKEKKPEVIFDDQLTDEQRTKILREKGEEIVFGLKMQEILVILIQLFNAWEECPN